MRGDATGSGIPLIQTYQPIRACQRAGDEHHRRAGSQ